MKSKFTETLIILTAFSLIAPVAKAEYKTSKVILLGEDGGWDYVTADPQTRQLFIARMNRVMVIDLNTEKKMGEVKGLDGAHGIALDKDTNRGFATSGNSGEVFVFDLKTLAVTEKVKVGERPDALVYDSFSKQVFVFNGKSKSASIIDVKTLKISATLPLDGKPEFTVSDEKGKVFIAIEDKNEIEVIDSKLNKVIATYPTKPCDEPSALAIDVKTEQLIVGCGNQTTVILDGSTGKITQNF